MQDFRETPETYERPVSIIAVAEAQRLVLIAVLMQLSFVVLKVLPLGDAKLIIAFLFAIFQMVAAYRLGAALRYKLALLYAALLMLPLVGLFVLLYLNSRATGLLRERGVPVGLMGVPAGEISRLKTAASSDASRGR